MRILAEEIFRLNNRHIKLNSKYIKTCLTGIVLMVVVLCITLYVYADSQSKAEYKVKSAFIYNIINFIEWPIDQGINDAINLCVVGKNHFGTALDSFEYNTIGDKVLAIEYVPLLQDIGGHNVVFICPSEKKRLKQILQTLAGTNILTIGDTKGFAQQGVIINFYIKDEKVRFEINVDAAKRANLKISAKLLRLAKIVHGISDK
ncbi:MAG: YfiR family protein [Candidatus Scalindua sp.]|jgi:hypothetical protein|nr:YfiR family protein [Candidatus Scalindua sp.]MBT5305517.1 YfiR family protein [Candidatus Scalindua sp.]MBT6048389.1 YfiR family protein [Candidatus Scalindua sp.]MBT6226137.1 YfiR family protein [Candidatus Scalindua sp.]MBT6561219.1 YfiR family protein [Candidatus Scalindua sp.]